MGRGDHFLDVCTAIPFARLREQGRALTYVGFKAFSVVITVVLAVAFGLAGFYETSFGVGWVFVGNLIASLLTLLAILTTTNRTLPRIDGKLLRRVLVYSLPLMVSGIAGTANEFIYPQMIKYLVPEGAMGEVGIYGAIVKIGMVLMLFVQMYRLAAEPFFLADYKKSDFLQMNAAALKYYVLVSMFIFLGIAFSGIFSDSSSARISAKESAFYRWCWVRTSSTAYGSICRSGTNGRSEPRWLSWLPLWA